MAKQKETALAAREKTEIVITGYNRLADMDIAAVMAEELDGLDAGFERIKITSAGSTVFEVPGKDPGEPEAAKEFSTVMRKFTWEQIARHFGEGFTADAVKQKYSRYLRRPIQGMNAEVLAYGFIRPNTGTA